MRLETADRESFFCSKWFVFLVTVAVYVPFGLHFQFQIPSDTHDRYLPWADILIQHRFNYFEWVKEVHFVVPPSTYFLFVAMLAMTKVLLGNYFILGMHGLIIIVHAYTAVMLYGLLRELTGDKGVAWGTVAMYLACYQILAWSRYLITDSFFMALMFYYFVTLARFIVMDRPDGRIWGLAHLVLLLAISLFLRPSAGFLLLSTAAALSFWLIHRKYPSVKTLAWHGAIVASFVVAGMTLHAFIMRDVTLWPFQLGKAYLADYISPEYHGGVVVAYLPYTYHQPPETVWDYLLISFDKFISFYAIFAWKYRLSHKVFNLLTMGPIWIGAMIAAMGVFTFKGDKWEPWVTYSYCAIIFCFSLATYISLTQLDIDWRYQLPLLPFMVFLAGIGVYRIKMFWQKNWMK